MVAKLGQVGLPPSPPTAVVTSERVVKQVPLIVEHPDPFQRCHRSRGLPRAAQRHSPYCIAQQRLDLFLSRVRINNKIIREIFLSPFPEGDQGGNRARAKTTSCAGAQSGADAFVED